jgi:ankyrin repeat protein
MNFRPIHTKRNHLKTQVFKSTGSEFFCLCRKNIFPLFLLFLFIGNQAFSQLNPNELALFNAVEANDINLTDSLLIKGTNPSVQDEEGISPLMLAVQNNNYDIVSLLIKAGADLNAKPWNGMTALTAAVRANNPDITAMLIDRGSDVNNQDMYGATPLFYSSVSGNFFIGEMLLNAGANPNTYNYFKTSPLEIASISENFEVCALLLDYNADPDHADSLGHTALHYAVAANDGDIVRLLLEKNAKRHLSDYRGYSPLAQAVIFDNPEIAALLLNEGTGPLAQGHSPMNLARFYNNRNMVRLLKCCFTKDYRIIPAQYYFSIRNMLNRENYFPGSSFGIYDFRYKLQTGIGFFFRPASKKVFRSLNDSTDFQFREKRYAFDFTLNKDIPLITNLNGSIGLSTGGGLVYSWTYYRGTGIRRPAQWIWTASGGMYFKSTYWGARLSYQYLKLNERPSQNGMAELSLNFYINRMFKAFKMPDMEVW